MSEKGRRGGRSVVTFRNELNQNSENRDDDSQDGQASQGSEDTLDTQQSGESHDTYVGDRSRQSEDTQTNEGDQSSEATTGPPKESKGSEEESSKEDKGPSEPPVASPAPTSPISPPASPFASPQDSEQASPLPSPVTSPVRQRVRFRSDLRQEFEYPYSPGSEDADSENEKVRRLSQPHRPSTPYLHEKDISETPLGERTTDGEVDGQAKEEESLEHKLAPVSRAHAVSRSIRERLRTAHQTIKEKTIKFAERLGRETSGGDDLTHGVYREDWASGGVPLSDVTDNKHKTDEEKRDHQKESSSEAHRLVRELTQDQSSRRQNARGKPYPHGGQDFPGGQGESAMDSALRYRQGGGGVLSQLMKLNGPQQGKQRGESGSTSSSDAGTPKSGGATPRKEKPKWYKKQQGTPSAAASGAGTPVASDLYSAASKRRGKGPQSKMQLEDEIRITVQIAEIIARQRYIMQLCKALMKFGAPTHRLEEYMQMTAKVLEMDSQFLYLPGCMIMSFDDPSTRTTEVKLVRVAQGIDLSRLANTHSVYKNVVHDIIGVEEAIQELEDIMNRKPRYNKWIVVLTYGLATASVGPFAFSARPIDIPIIFMNGCILGAMQHVVAPRSALYSNVFEVTASVLMSFIARAFGSIKTGIVNGKQQYLFCFSAISQSSIALILPGFLVLTSSLELQSHQIVAGSIRMVYAIIYSLFLGYGITVGTTIYGLIDASATSDTSCPKSSKNHYGSPYVQRFPFVAVMAFFMIIVNQGRPKQAPVMVTIALSGYVTNYFCVMKLGSNSQVANTVGAFTIGIIGNLYSRLWHGHAATAILPGIFVLVPSALAATGSLISGVQSADQIRSNVSHSGAGSSNPGAGLSSQTSVFNLGFGMIQVAIGITIGLFLAALIVYPYGKRRSGLFSF
ncbi:hypothetical protein PHISCL_04564 [Aspergillus sclerotialis]|uniref:DUF1212 domain membrane protein n=1 Tax=Aspergillus sclerotialis TaxID=2070753 RepID=A0A3A2ZNV7_9EURO|nr:hypothetical protein PHISCL_04564 [Aspergillus sclerotialis]